VTAAGAVVEGLAAGALASWVVVEATILWKGRVPVTFDHRTRRWRSVRAIKKEAAMRNPPAVYPMSNVKPEPTRLHVVRDIAS
jgi:hypothetical protein